MADLNDLIPVEPMKHWIVNGNVTYCLDKSLIDLDARETVFMFGGSSELVSKKIGFLSCEEHQMKNHVKT